MGWDPTKLPQRYQEQIRAGKTPKPRSNEKASEQALKDAYAELGNVWKVAERFGMCGQSVHERLVKLGVKLKLQPLTFADETRVREVYASGIRRGDGKLDALAAELGRTKQFLCRRARIMGLTDQHTTTTPELAAEHGQRTKARIATDGHPRGMKGKTHTPDTRAVIGQSSQARWEQMTPDDKSAQTLKMLKTKAARGNLVNPRPKTTWKQGWREINGRRIFFRSRWEFNYACYLEWLRVQNQIVAWEHEPQTFWFEKIKRGVRSYLPDFRITEREDRIYYIEVKGWMDDRSKTKLKRMKKYHPTVELRLVDSKSYRALAKRVAKFVPGWETD
jgi:hypothetical protein